MRSTLSPLRELLYSIVLRSHWPRVPKSLGAKSGSVLILAQTRDWSSDLQIGDDLALGADCIYIYYSVCVHLRYPISKIASIASRASASQISLSHAQIMGCSRIIDCGKCAFAM